MHHLPKSMMTRAKQRFGGFTFLLLLLLTVTARPARQFAYSVVIPGLEYVHVEDTNGPWSVHVARLDRSHREFEIVSTLAQGKIQGLSTLSEQVKALPPKSGQPLAAVNGDFFVIKPGPIKAIRWACKSSTESWSAFPPVQLSGRGRLDNSTSRALHQNFWSPGQTGSKLLTN
jgi:hypothetical protein